MKNGHSHLNKAERRKAIDDAERKKYDASHKPKSTRKGGARKRRPAGSRLAFDALKKKK